MGSKEGGEKAAKTNKQRHGADWYKRIGAKGGNTPKKTPSGFAAMPRETVSKWGRKGGAASSRKGIKHGEGNSRAVVYQRKQRELTAYELHTGGEA